MYKVIDFKTRKVVTPHNLVFSGGEFSPWEIEIDLDEVRKQLNVDAFRKETPRLSKYLPFLPLEKEERLISLQEVATPLIKSQVLGKQLGIDLYFKLEGKNPTGSFKDRGSAIEVSIAKALGAKAIVLASTGNMAASCACYAAVAKLPCFVLVPEGAPAAKLTQVIAFGGHIVQIKGDYNDAISLAEKIADKMGFYLGGDYAFRAEGQKTAAFELVDQFHGEAPDAIIVPIGCGTNITAYKKGFYEYQQLGFSNQMPIIIGAQARGSAAVVESYQENRRDIRPLIRAHTVASAISATNPIDGIKALDAIYSTQGCAVAVTDEEMLRTQYILSREEGLFVESASATTLAVLMKLCNSQEREKIRWKKSLANKRVVCVLTGDGLKDATLLLNAAIQPPAIAKDLDEFMTLYQNQFFNGYSAIFEDKNKVVFQTEPAIEDVRKALEELLHAKYGQPYVSKIHQLLRERFEKNRKITIADFQEAVQEGLEALLKHFK